MDTKVALAATAVEVGFTKLATQLVHSALESSLSSTDQAIAAIEMAVAGDSAGAQKIVERLSKQYPLSARGFAN